ncbi:MAG: type IV pili methyl-accepting chemotaxis transducer N-terminal domain-containing protein [Alphaproteobacteria bacterium]|nr:type IV pili methyl-accepting chemotaxis transducer N-terminal domain-containing protein [Alphaproteobacteria bacterium]
MIAAFGSVLCGPPWVAPQESGWAAVAQEARSSNSLKTILRQVNELEAQAQRMTLSIAQLFLGFDKESNLARLRTAHEGFESNFAKLNQGDASIGLPPPSPEMLEILRDVRLAWDIHKGVGLDVIVTGEVKRTDIAIAAQLDQLVIDAAVKARQAYQTKYLKNNLISIDVLTLIQAEEQSIRIEKMAKRLLLIAINYDVGKQREGLAASTVIFNRVLNGMIEGDTELQLIPVREPALRTELIRSKDAWSRVQPQFKSAAKGTPTAVEDLEIIITDIEALSESTQKTLDILEKM